MSPPSAAIHCNLGINVVTLLPYVQPLSKTVISQYMHGSAVLGCFLGASKAFDLFDYGVLFQKLLDRGLPLPSLKFLVSWYGSQQMRVCWGDRLSERSTFYCVKWC